MRTRVQFPPPPPNTKVRPKTSVNAGFFMPEDARGDKTSKESEGKVEYDVLVS